MDADASTLCSALGYLLLVVRVHGVAASFELVEYFPASGRVNVIYVLCR